MSWSTQQIDDPEQGRLVFPSNHHKLGTTTLAVLCKDRRQVGLFFKALAAEPAR